MYFFAYGTLASGGLMAEKCPGAVFIARAVLQQHRMSGLNVLPDERSSVDGVLWEIEDSCLEVLDGYENYPDFYQRKTLTVHTETTGDVDALVYFIPGE